MSKRDCSVSTSSDPFGWYAVPEYGGRRRHRRHRRRRHGPRVLWLVGAAFALPLVIPALALAARTVFIVLRAVLMALVAVAEGLFVGLGWLLALGLLVALPGFMKTYQARRRLQPKPVAPPAPAPETRPLAGLALQTRDLLDARRAQLPAAVHAQLDSMRAQLMAVAAQLSEGEDQPQLGAELQGLLGEELPQLIEAYLKVPVALRQRALQGGMSPEAQLVAGLATLDEQLSVFHERLAARDLQALAVHQRYLDLKYKR